MNLDSQKQLTFDWVLLFLETCNIKTRYPLSSVKNKFEMSSDTDNNYFYNK